MGANRLSQANLPDGSSYNSSVPFVVGTGSTAGTWLGSLDGLTAYYDGLLILYKPSVKGASTTTLNINSLGAKTCYLNSTTKLTTHFPANQPILLAYSTSQNSGCWECIDNYDSNSDTYDRNRYKASVKAGTSALVAANIIVGKDGVFNHLKSGGAFDISYPILYLNEAVAANGTTTNIYDIIHFTVTTTQSISLTAYLPVYIKGTLSGNIFTPVSTTPLTQTIPTAVDNYYYMYLGNATAATTVYLQEVHPIYAYKNGKFGLVANDASSVNGHTVAKDVPSDAEFTDTTYTFTNGGTNKFTVTPSGGTAQDVTFTASDSTKLPLAGGTMTGTLNCKANVYTDAANTGSLNMGNSNIYGVNSIYTADASEGAGEGINFYRDASHVDTLWMSGGDLLFVPNRALGTSTSKADSQKVGRFTANPTSGKAVITDGTTGGMKSSSYTLGAACEKSFTTSVTSGSADLVTSGAVYTAIDNLPEPMIFKGSVGTGGTITSLPTAAAANEGFTYKVITALTTPVTAKVGDTVISNGSEWVVIPSGDEPNGTVTSITLKATSPIAVDSTAAITTSGTRTFSHANSGVTAGTYRSVTVNATGHVTDGTNPTTISGYGITDAKIASGTITLGSDTITPLTAASTLNATKLSGTIPTSCYTDTKNTAGSTDISTKIFLVGASSQAASAQTYSDNEVYVTSGALQTKTTSASAGINANTANSGTTGGVSLYSTSPSSYGLVMRNTGTSSGQLGKHGYVQGDWAGYLCFDGATNRGYIFRQAGNNIASIGGTGNAVFNGSVTIGGNTTNTSGARMEFNSTDKSIEFTFV